jgi:hypothetical protein
MVSYCVFAHSALPSEQSLNYKIHLNRTVAATMSRNTAMPLRCPLLKWK